MRKATMTLLLVGLSTGIAYLFWQADYKYSLPTPVPLNYQVVLPGSAVDLADRLPLKEDRPVFLHFFNPRCPCSRFNVPQFRQLARRYADRISFAVVVISPETYTAEEIREKVGVDIPVSFDRSLATACGVYSTPQAVLIDADRKLFYRGNYNKSRYCDDRATNYAEQAIDSLLNDHADPQPAMGALKSYGCALTNCEKK